MKIVMVRVDERFDSRPDHDALVQNRCVQHDSSASMISVAANALQKLMRMAALHWHQSRN